MKKGKIIWVLIIWFLWAVGMDIELLYCSGLIIPDTILGGKLATCI